MAWRLVCLVGPGGGEVRHGSRSHVKSALFRSVAPRWSGGEQWVGHSSVAGELMFFAVDFVAMWVRAKTRWNPNRCLHCMPALLSLLACSVNQWAFEDAAVIHAEFLSTLSQRPSRGPRRELSPGACHAGVGRRFVFAGWILHDWRGFLEHLHFERTDALISRRHYPAHPRAPART